MDFKIIYEDKDLLVVDKPAGIVVFPEGQTTGNTLIEALVEKYPEEAIDILKKWINNDQKVQ